jgi:hypothetical protein
VVRESGPMVINGVPELYSSISIQKFVESFYVLSIEKGAKNVAYCTIEVTRNALSFRCISGELIFVFSNYLLFLVPIYPVENDFAKYLATR